MEKLLSYYCELCDVLHYGHSTIEALNNLTEYLPQKNKEFVWAFTDRLRSIETLRKNRLMLDDGESWLSSSSDLSSSLSSLSDNLSKELSISNKKDD